MTADDLTIHVTCDGQPAFHCPVESPVIYIGRQRKHEPEPYVSRLLEDDSNPGERRQRIVIAPYYEETVSRDQLRVDIESDDTFRVHNLSQKVEVQSETHVLGPDAQLTIHPHQPIQIGRWSISIGPATALSAEATPFETLARNTIVPGQREEQPAVRELLESHQALWSTAESQSLLEAIVTVVQSAAASPHVESEAVRTLVQQSRFQRACVLRREGGRWVEAAKEQTRDKGDWSPSRTVLEVMCRENRPVRQRPSLSAASLQDITAVIAAPIYDRHAEIVGALYADRRISDGESEANDVEDFLVRALASSVAAGWERMQAEKQAVEERIRFEQFFTPELARGLEEDPNLLKGRSSQISVLFCDVRGFSKISERVGPETTMRWIGNVMSSLAEAVLECDGVLVDFIGDELMAMWGAPIAHDSHEELACRAALQMATRLEKLNQHWQPILGSTFDIGIGIHSGEAFVGNTGSSQKFKYGPLGHTVNLASRVQSANKYFGTRILITGATEGALASPLPRRRLTQVRVVGIETPVTLFELASEPTDQWQSVRRCYEQVLQHFEAGDLAKAVETAGDAVLQCPSDKPTLLIMKRLTEALLAGEPHPDPVWALPSK